VSKEESKQANKQENDQTSKQANKQTNKKMTDHDPVRVPLKQVRASTCKSRLSDATICGTDRKAPIKSVGC